MQLPFLIPTAILVTAASLVRAQSESQAVCWKARNCPGAKWDSKAALQANADSFCTRDLVLEGAYQEFGLSSAILTGPPVFENPQQCKQLFNNIVNSCLGKSNGGFQDVSYNSTRLIVSFGNCEVL